MIKKTLITTVALGLTIGAVQVMPGAQGPLYDQDGNLILDLPQEPYKDLSTPDNQQEPIVLEEDNRVATTEQESSSTVQTEVPNTTETQEGNSVQGQTTNNNENTQNTGSTQDTENFEGTNNTVTQEKEVGRLEYNQATFLNGDSEDIIVHANMQIKSITVNTTNGLPPNSWLVSGTTVTFKSSILNNAYNGQYIYTVEFIDGSTDEFKLKVTGVFSEDNYWSQNIRSFSTNPISNTHKDFEIMSSLESINVKQITIDGQLIPASAYKVIGSSVILSKDFLSKLSLNERARIKLTYNQNLIMDFSLEITDEIEKGNTSEKVDC